MTSLTTSRTKSLYKKRRRDVVYDRLFQAVTAAESYPGQQLAPIKDMAARFGTSIRTVQMALDQLENEGYVQRRHGSGTFIRPRAVAGARALGQVVIAIPSQNNEALVALSNSIVRELHAAGCSPTTIDVTHNRGANLMHRAAEGSVDTFIVHGGRTFPFGLIEQPAFRDKNIIAVEEWASSITTPRLHQVLDDYAYGGQQVADHLFRAGHRRALIVAADGSLNNLHRRDGIACGASRGHAFIDHWTALGGTWTTLRVFRDPTTVSGFDLDFGALVDHLTAPASGSDPAPGNPGGPVTAIFGYRDVEAWTVQSLLQRHRPDLLAKVEIIGYGDTTWSRTALPPLSTVAYPVEDMAQWVRHLYDELVAAHNAGASTGGGSGGTSGGGMGPQRIMVRPQLIDRSRHPLRLQQQLQTSQPAPAEQPGASPHTP